MVQPETLQPSLFKGIPDPAILDCPRMTDPSLPIMSENLLEKNPSAFKTISEVATMLGLPQHVLRFWESKFRQIKPMKLRGGRRYYRPEDIEIISLIKHLLYEEGYTINGAKKAFDQARKAQKTLHEPVATQAALNVAIKRSAEAMPLLAPKVEAAPVAPVTAVMQAAMAVVDVAAPAASSEAETPAPAMPQATASRHASVRQLLTELSGLRAELDGLRRLRVA